MDIKNFMIETVGETREVKIEKYPEPFVIQAISEIENDRLKKECTATSRRGKSGSITRELDTDKYGAALLVRCVKSPDLHNAELQAFHKTEGSASDTLKTMLLAGEYANLTQEVLDLNGFGETDEEIKDEIKN